VLPKRGHSQRKNQDNPTSTVRTVTKIAQNLHAFKPAFRKTLQVETGISHSLASNRVSVYQLAQQPRAALILLGSTRFEVVVSIFSIHLKYPDHKKLGGAGFIRDGESSFGHNRLGSFLTAD
jgi:hypothetical protein